MDRLNEYIKNMKFKKRRMGGLDEEDVLLHITEICGIVRMEMEENAKALIQKEQALVQKEKALEERYKNLLADYEASKEQLQKSADACCTLQDKNEELNARVHELQNEAERYGKAREEAERIQREYSNKYRELMKTVDALHKVNEENQQELRASVEAEREKMLAETEKERRAAESEIERLNREISGLSRKKQAMQDSIRSEREQWKQHLDWFASRIESDTENRGV